MSNSRKMVKLSLLLSISIVVSVAESIIPVFVPGVKLGLANVVTLYILYSYGRKEAFLVLIVRLLLVGILRGTIFSYPFYLSVSGGLLSFVVMALIFKSKNLSIIGVSILGSLFHGIGQILMAILLLETSTIVYYLPIITALSIPSGILTAIFARKVVSRV